jgi:hypothetical protein
MGKWVLWSVRKGARSKHATQRARSGSSTRGRSSMYNDGVWTWILKVVAGVHWWRWRERRENEGEEARTQVLRGDYG